MLYTLLTILFLTACLIQLCYAVFFALSKRRDRSEINTNKTPTSIIICAKNEAQNLQQFLPFVLAQDYPKESFEVIVVNDQSIDDTAEVLKKIAVQYPNLKIITISVDEIKTLPGKKYALSQGITAAQFEHLLLTDADCKPATNQWLSLINSKLQNPKSKIQNPKLVLGYGAYEAHSGLLNKFIRWETAHTCMQYVSYAAAGLPYMGVGRNLSYSKSLLKDLDSDASFQAIYSTTPSGDDDLLIAKIATKDNVDICLSKEAHTISIPQKTWATWWKQKTRHMSTGKYYPQNVKSLLGLYALSHCVYWFIGIELLIIPIANCQLQTANYQLPTVNFIVVIAFFLRLTISWLNAASWYKTLNEKKLLLFYPLGDLGWALYNVFLSPYIFWKNRQAWK